jgi:hypothetical protein
MIRRVRRVARGESGMAMMTTIMVMAVLTGFGVTISMVSINNSQNAGRDRQAGEALNLAEGGVAQAVEYMRAFGVKALTCYESVYDANPNDPSCVNAASPWANPDPAKSQKVTIGTLQNYRVWIAAIQAPSIVNKWVGRYRVHSEGLSGAGPGARRIEVDLTVKPFGFPLGIFGDEITAGGNVGVTRESVFAKNCVNQREKITFLPGDDLAYGIPPAVHSAQYISTATNGCSNNDNKNVHDPAPRGTGVCNTTASISNVRYDQDRLGGSLAGTPCVGAGSAYPQTSAFDETALASYGYQTGGLSKAEYDALRARARSMGTYWTTPTNPALPASFAANNPTAVLFYDLSNSGGTVSIQQSDIPGYETAACGARSIVIVVINGDLTFNGGVDIVGSLFAPQGSLKGSGGATIIGTVFAHRLDSITGGFSASLNSCFFDAFPGGLMDVTATKFVEVDR